MTNLKLIATKIMGWKFRNDPKTIKPGDCWVCADKLFVYPEARKGDRIWSPLTNPADAWELESALAIRIGSCEAIYTQWNDGAWKIGIVGCDWYLDGDTRENAVCKLAEKLANELK